MLFPSILYCSHCLTDVIFPVKEVCNQVYEHKTFNRLKEFFLTLDNQKRSCNNHFQGEKKMAVQFNSDADVQRTAHGYSVLPENLVIIPELSGRAEATDIDGLASDILANGQLEPAVCWKNNEGWPVLAAGHRRYRAVSKLNEGKSSEQKRRLLFNYVAAKNEEEAFDYTVRENRNRINPSPLDDATNMHVYQTRFGLGDEQLARKYYPSILSAEDLAKAVAEVKSTLKLLELSDDNKELMRQGKLGTSAALQLASIPNRKTQDDIAQESLTKNKGKKVKVADVKEAKTKQGITKQKTVTNISQNTPVKQLEKFRVLAEIAASLASECMAKEFRRNVDKETVIEFAQQILVMCAKLNVPLESSSDKWAHENIKLATALDKVAA